MLAPSFRGPLGETSTSAACRSEGDDIVGGHPQHPGLAREKQKERERETDRHMYDREREKAVETHTHTHTHRERDTQTDRQRLSSTESHQDLKTITDAQRDPHHQHHHHEGGGNIMHHLLGNSAAWECGKELLSPREDSHATVNREIEKNIFPSNCKDLHTRTHDRYGKTRTQSL